MCEKVIGVLGGMGPEATLTFFKELITQTPARTDQEHLRVLIDSNPKIPDRTRAILENGESPVPAMVASAGSLERAGADFIVIPCISAHFFLDELRSNVNLPILSIFDVMADHISQNHPNVSQVGLLATTGTVQGGRFQERFDRAGIRTLVPGTEDQLLIMSAIYDIKDSHCLRSRDEISRSVNNVACRLATQGALGIVAGCTEIPLVLQSLELPVPVFNPLILLARAAISAAGREPNPADITWSKEA